MNFNLELPIGNKALAVGSAVLEVSCDVLIFGDWPTIPNSRMMDRNQMDIHVAPA
jgi:hypothetical protein